jgi:hypothetical protein
MMVVRLVGGVGVIFAVSSVAGVAADTPECVATVQQDPGPAYTPYRPFAKDGVICQPNDSFSPAEGALAATSMFHRAKRQGPNSLVIQG